MGTNQSKNKNLQNKQQQSVNPSINNNCEKGSFQCQQFTSPLFHNLITFESKNPEHYEFNNNKTIPLLENISKLKSLHCDIITSINYVTIDGHGFEINKNSVISQKQQQQNLIYFERKRCLVELSNSYKDNYTFLKRDLIIRSERNDFGQEDDVREYEMKLPVIDYQDQFIKVVDNFYNSFYLLTSMGKVFIKGKNSGGILGMNDKDLELTEFTLHPNLDHITSKIVDIKIGGQTCILRCENGDVYGCGFNSYIASGVGARVYKFTLIEELKGKVKQFDCGEGFFVYLTFDGEVFGWGLNLGIKNNKSSNSSFTKITFNNESVTKFKSVLAGNNFKTMAFLSDKNTIIYCGHNNFKNLKTNIISEGDHFVEFDFGLDKFIGNFGMKRNEMIEFGIISNLVKGIIICRDLLLEKKNLQLFYENLKAINCFTDIDIIF